MPKSKTSRKKKAKTDFPNYTGEEIEMIREKAHSIWEKKGKPENTVLDDWLGAEEELKQEGII